MATMLIIMFILAIIHFAYENIISPTLRIYQRNKLFALRDELRDIDFYSLNKEDKQVFEYIENSLNNCIQNLPYMNIYTFTKYRQAYSENEQLRKTVDTKIKKIENCSVHKIKNIFSNAGEITYQTIFINSGMLLFYLLPITFILIIFKCSIDFLKNMARNMIVSSPDISLKYHDNIIG